MIRRPPRSTLSSSSAASDVYKRQVYALGFAARSALTFGGMSHGQARDIMLYNKYRVFAFVLALGEVDDLKYATAAGAISYGFPAVSYTHLTLPTKRIV